MRKQTRRLYKSRTDRIIAGVCAGVAEYLRIDPTIVRLLWVLSLFLGGIGLVLYIASMILMPVNPSMEPAQSRRSSSRNFWGLFLIGLGALLLLYNFGVVPIFHWWDGFSWKIAFALLLIGIGCVILLSYAREKSAPDEVAGEKQRPDRRRLYRSLHNRKVFGVCGGIGEYFDVDPTLVRLAFVVITLYSFGFGILAYLILTIVTPEEELKTSPV